MAWKIECKMVTVSGNKCIVTPLTRRAAEEFRAKMSAADGNEDETMKTVCDLVTKQVTLADEGKAPDPDEMPVADLLALFKIVVGADAGNSLADFTPTP